MAQMVNPKPPEWAAQITGIPAARIVKLAREIAGAKPTYITQRLGPSTPFKWRIGLSRYCNAFAILTGNVGNKRG